MKIEEMSLGDLAVDIVFPKLFGYEKTNEENLFKTSTKIALNSYQTKILENIDDKEMHKELTYGVYNCLEFSKAPSLYETRLFLRNIFDLDKILASIMPKHIALEKTKLLTPVVLGTFFSIVNRDELDIYSYVKKLNKSISDPKVLHKKKDVSSRTEVLVTSNPSSYYLNLNTHNYRKLVALSFYLRPFKESNTELKETLYEQIFALNLNSVQRKASIMALDSCFKNSGDKNKSAQYIQEQVYDAIEKYNNSFKNEGKSELHQIISSVSLKEIFSERNHKNPDDFVFSVAGLYDFKKNENLKWYLGKEIEPFYKDTVLNTVFSAITEKILVLGADDMKYQTNLVNKKLDAICSAKNEDKPQVVANTTSASNSHINQSSTVSSPITLQEVKDLHRDLNFAQIGKKTVAHLFSLKKIEKDEQKEIMKIILQPPHTSTFAIIEDLITNDDGKNDIFLTDIVFSCQEQRETLSHFEKLNLENIIEKKLKRQIEFISKNNNPLKQEEFETSYAYFLDKFQDIYNEKIHLDALTNVMKVNQNLENSSVHQLFKEKYPALYMDFAKSFVTQYEEGKTDFFFTVNNQNVKYKNLITISKTPVEFFYKVIINDNFNKNSQKMNSQDDEPNTELNVSFKI